MKAEYVGNSTCFSVDIDLDDDNDDIESLSIDGVKYDIEFLIEVAPDFIDWCYEQIEGQKENPYFHRNIDNTR